VNKILDDVKRPGENKREEKAESCEVHVALRTWGAVNTLEMTSKAVHELEFARSD